MRRTEFEIFHKGDYLALALDCANYAWENDLINDVEITYIERRIYEILQCVQQT